MRFAIILMFFIFVSAPQTVLAEDSSSSQSHETADKPIPQSWNEYFVEPAFIEKYRDDETKRRLCFDKDILKHGSDYNNIIMPARNIGFSSSGSTPRTQHVKTFDGVRDFIVLDNRSVLIKTPETGINLISLNKCPPLHRAKYIPVSRDNYRQINGSFRLIPTRRCLIKHEDLSFLTQNRTGLRACRIKAIHPWNGPFDIDMVKAENDQPKASLVEENTPP